MSVDRPMPNESLALPELLAGLSDAADYDAALAAVMATESGRRFLTEFANRNRNADTTLVVGAIAKVEAAIRGEAAPLPTAAKSMSTSVGAGELIEIAAALDRIATAIAVGAPRALRIAAAVERIQDIAFVLHERPVEATLRDTLDAAVRELAVAAASSDATVDTADLVRALASRVREMIDARMSPEPPAESFTVSPDDGADLAQAVAAFAATLPALAEVADVPAEAPGDVAVAPLADESEAIPPPQHQDISTAFPAEPTPTNAVAEPIEVVPLAEVDVAPVEAAAPPPQAEPEILDSASILSQAFADDHFAGAPVAAEAAVTDVHQIEPTTRDEPPHQELPNQELPNQELPSQELPNQEQSAQELPPQEPPGEAALPVQEAVAAPVVADPEEDPADLFAPEPVLPPAEPAVEAVTPVAAEPPLSEPQSVVPPPPPMRAIPRPPLSDPLAAVRELSEEELIALFS
jgi:hypothetical protein